MPLIPEAAAIKETLKHADALSGAVAEEMKLMQQPTRGTRADVRLYRLRVPRRGGGG